MVEYFSPVFRIWWLCTNHGLLFHPHYSNKCLWQSAKNHYSQLPSDNNNGSRTITCHSNRILFRCLFALIYENSLTWCCMQIILILCISDLRPKTCIHTAGCKLLLCTADSEQSMCAVPKHERVGCPFT